MRDQLLGGRYRLVRPLGEGGMGQVWEAADEALDRPVAVKMISLLAGGGSRGVEARARFLREARITARLQHPNIVTIHDLGETGTGEDRVPFLVMELVRGEGLDAVLRRGAVPLADTARWGAQVGDALAAAHGAGVLHRDVKPSNIIITATGTVKVLDFGVARAADPAATADRLTQTGFIVGTPPYMAPEQARGAPEPRSDLYALGCLLFELATGRLPFQAPDTVGYLSAHLTQEPPAPGAVAAGIPPAWDDLVLTLLRKDPAQRFPSAAGLAHALRTLDGAPAHPPPGGGPGPEHRVPGPLDGPRPGAVTGALLCLPGLLVLVGMNVETFQYVGSTPMAVFAVAGIAAAAVLARGALLLQQRRAAGRWMIASAGAVAAVQCWSAVSRVFLVGGLSPAVVFGLAVGAVTAAAGAAAAVAALGPAAAQWCRGRGTPAHAAPEGPGGGSAATAVVAIVMAVVCLPGLLFMAAKTVEYLQDPEAPTELVAVNMVLSIAEAAVLAAGVPLLSRRVEAGRWMIAAAGGFTALHGASTSAQHLIAGGPESVAVIAYVIGPVMAVAAVTAVVTASHPSTRRWCRGRAAPTLAATRAQDGGTTERLGTPG